MPRKGEETQIGILAFIQPFIALLFAIRHFRSPWAKNVVWFFATFYGFTFVISSQGLDSARYAQALYEMHHSEVTLENILTWLYSEETMYLDIFQPLVTFLVSLVSDNAQILFGVLGFIYGYFYSRNLWFVLAYIKNKPVRIFVIPFLITLALILPIWYINGVRMWTAAQVFLFGALPLLVNGERKKILWVLASIFVHFSFFVPVAILFLFLIFGKRTTLYLILYLFTFFLVEVNIRQVNAFLMQYSPPFLETKVISYTSEEYFDSIQKAQKGLNWYVLWHKKVFAYTILVFLLVLYFKRRNLVQDQPGLENLYNASLFFGAWTNVLDKIPSGGRFVTLFNFMAIAVILYYLFLLQRQPILRRLAKLSILPLLFYIVVAIRIGFDTIGLWTIIGNPFVALFVQHDIALIQLLK